MAVKKYKPTSPARRFMTVAVHEEITKKEPERSLTEHKNRKGGRNSYGKPYIIKAYGQDRLAESLISK